MVVWVNVRLDRYIVLGNGTVMFGKGNGNSWVVICNVGVVSKAVRVKFLVKGEVACN